MKTNAKLVLTIVITITLLAGCGGDDPSGPETTTGAVEVTTQTTGPDPDDYDDDGYTVNVDGANSQSVDSSDTVVIDGLQAGTHNVELTGVTETCAVESDNPQMVEVTAGETASVSFEVFCKEVLRNQIVFYSTREGGGIQVMDPDGNLVNAINGGLNPDISPDGTKLLYFGNNNIFISDADGKNEQQLTTIGTDRHPYWSPEGDQIVFVSERDGNYEIYIMNSDGTDQTNITSTEFAENQPSWSPDGSKIAFSSNEDAFGREIFVMNTDGSEKVRLTDNSKHDDEPVWSPDGSKIAYISNSSGFGLNERELFVMNADGTNKTRLTNNSGTESAPSWSPDGSMIIFESNVDLNDEIYKINADGTGLTNLTQNGSNDRDPDWSPVE